MKIDDGTYNDDEQEQKKNSGLNKDLSNVNSSKLTTGGQLTKEQSLKGFSLIDYCLQETKKLNDVNNKTVIFKNIEPFKLNITKGSKTNLYTTGDFKK